LRDLTPQQRRAILLFAAAVAFAVKLALALNTYGTNDVYTYERFGLWSRYLGAELYRIAPDLNHPPSMLHFLSGILRFSDFTHVPFQFWLRFCCIVADAGSLWLVCRILGERLAQRPVFLAVLLIAISPMNILISGFHGNTDPVMIFFVLLAVWLAGYRGRIAAGGAAFGLAFCIKIAPVIAAPALFFALPDWRKRLRFFGVAAVVTIAAWSPYIFDDPRAVLHQVFGYQSSYGLWGVSWLLRQLSAAWPASWRVNLICSQAGSFLAMAAVILLSWWMSRRPNRPALYAQMRMIFLFFFAVTSGFAVQYLAWLTPWIAGLGIAPAAFYTTAGSIFLLVVYNYWALGAPWYLAIAYPWTPHQYFQVLCWLSVVVLAVIAWRRMRGAPPAFPRRIPRGVVWTGSAVAAIALLIYPATVHMRGDRLGIAPVYAKDEALYTEAELYHNLALELFRRGRRADANRVDARAAALERNGEEISEILLREQPARSTMRTPENLMNASLDAYNRQDFAECAADAREALRHRPGMPAAWNNIVVCDASLGKWESAIAAAREGVRLEPESLAVRRNLEWVLSERARADVGQ
jgi:hypothetical protein